MGCRGMFCLFLAASAFCPIGVALGGVETVISDVPSYIWYYGCAPTAGGMVLGYYDAHGYSNIITGGDGSNSWATNQQAVKDMIASPGHIADYWGVDAPLPHHLDNCVADFMHTSRDTLADGATSENYILVGLMGYAQSVGYTNAGGGWDYSQSGYSDGLWVQFLSEIDHGRPMVLYVDSTDDGTPDHNGDGVADHFVSALGYRYDGDPSNPTNPQYAAYNTWDNAVHWYPFVPVSTKTAFAIKSGAWFNLNDELPVARAGGPYALPVGLSGSITLDGSGSSDSDGDVVGWSWDLNQDGNEDLWGQTAMLTAADLDSLGWLPGESRDILLAVTDDMGATATATTRLTYAQPGDADHNGVVDAADYIALKSNFGITSGATWGQGDFDQDGDVDRDDLLLLAECFAQNTSHSMDFGGIAGIPEPATLFVMMAAGLPVLLKRRRRRNWNPELACRLKVVQ